MRFVFQEMWEFPFKFIDPGYRNISDIAVIRVISFVILMVIFCFPELLKRFDLNSYRFAVVFFDLLYLFFDYCFLFLILIENYRTVLRADIGFLAVCLSRVNRTEVDIWQGLINHDLRIIYHL